MAKKKKHKNDVKTDLPIIMDAEFNLQMQQNSD